MTRITYIEHDGTRHEVDVEDGTNLMAAAVDNVIEGAGGGEDDEEDDAPKGAAAGRETRLQELMKMNPMEKIRAALLGDKFDRTVLVRDSNKTVACTTSQASGR